MSTVKTRFPAESTYDARSPNEAEYNPQFVYRLKRFESVQVSDYHRIILSDIDDPTGIPLARIAIEDDSPRHDRARGIGKTTYTSWHGSQSTTSVIPGVCEMTLLSVTSTEVELRLVWQSPEPQVVT